jgi:hypothetical protein
VIADDKTGIVPGFDHGGGKRRPFIAGPRHGGQRLMHCQIGISGSMAGRDEEVSGHAVKLDRALLARVELQPFENFNHPPDLHVLGKVAGDRKRCPLGDVVAV